MLPTSTDSSTVVLVGATGDALLDLRAQALLELRHHGGALGDEDLPRLEEELLLGTHVGLAGAIHQHVADTIE